MKSAAIFLCTAVAVVGAAQTAPKPAPSRAPAFRLFFLAHEIGREDIEITETSTAQVEGHGGTKHVICSFHFDDRGTAVDLRGVLEPSPTPWHLEVKGRNYRLFSSDSDVMVTDNRAHVRDGTSEHDVDVTGKPFFPIDNYAPICVQEQLIKYWIARGRPAEINAAPSGPVRITSRGTVAGVMGPAPVRGARGPVEALAIEGVVWGTETAWIDQRTGDLLGLTTWAGALPFQATREGRQGDLKALMEDAVRDRIADLERLTRETLPQVQGHFALVGARLISLVAGAPPIDDATLIVRDGRIESAGRSADTPVPGGLPVIDARGKTIIPGLWDMHAHASQIDWAPVYLASGVTTIRDLGGEEGFLIAIRDAIRSGKALGPRYLLAGLVDGPGPRSFGAVTAATPDEGRAVVRRYHNEGFEQVKIYSLVAPEVVRAIVEEAHKLGMTVTGHVPAGMTVQSVVEAGFDSIAHMQLRGESGSDASKQQVAFFKEHGTVLDPTQSWNELGGRPAATPLDSLLPGISRLPRPLARMFASMAPGNGDPQATHARLVSSVRLLKDAIDAGLLVVAGTDKGVPGFSLQRELELYVEGGMTPLEALQTATIMPARAMKLDKELGTIEAGKRADLVVLDENPLERMANIRTARMVVTNGRLYDCNVLWKAAGFAPR